MFILCFTPIMALAFYVPRYTATADIEISLDNLGIQRIWSQVIFHNNLLIISWYE